MESLPIEQSDTLKQLQAMRGGEFDLPIGTQQVEEPAVEPVVEPVVEQVAQSEESEPAQSVVEIDGKTFATEKDAYTYLRSTYDRVKTEQLIQEAKLEGMQSAFQYIPQSHQPTPVIEEPSVDIDKFYADPTGYMAERERQIEQKLLSKLSATQQAQARDEAVWNDFATKYPDLSMFKDDVTAMAMQHRDVVSALGKSSPAKAMEFVATKLREKFDSYHEARKPTRTLPNSGASASPSGNKAVTTAKKSPEVNDTLDFAAQLRSIRK